MKSDGSVRTGVVGAYLMAIAAAWCVVALYVADASLPYNPIRLPGAEQVQAQVWIPEGWAFFTRNPREPVSRLLTRSEQGWTSVALTPSARPANLFGLDRGARAQGVELGLLLHEVRDAPWAECSDPIERCLERTTAVATVDNASPRPTLCGDVGIANQRRVPWAWSKSRDEIVMPSHVLRLEVRC